MAKKDKRKAVEEPSAQKQSSLFASGGEIDPALASLFSASTQAASAVPKGEERKSKRPRFDNERPRAVETKHDSGPSTANAAIHDEPVEVQIQHVLKNAENNGTAPAEQASTHATKRKRKQRDEDADLEGLYLERLAREEEREHNKLSQTKDLEAEKESQPGSAANEDKESAGSVVEADEREVQAEAGSSDGEESFEIPQHETLSSTAPSFEVEKSSRTVFLGNVSVEAIASKAAQKILRQHLSSFFSALSTQEPPHKIESLRFRSTAYDNKLPKKAAFVKKELMEATAKSTNAYVVYNTQAAAREAAKRLNGTVVLDRHMRVDQVAHPAKVDHKRCVFVGNLDFVDDDTAIREGNQNIDEKTRQKKKEPGDVEEGLWRQFGKAGTVESVRVVRDSKTRVGKGFAYVQFTDENGVEAALQFNDKKYPPMLPRKLRVVRAKAIKRKEQKLRAQQRMDSGNATYRPKLSSQEVSFQGRAGKLLGKAGAAQLQRGKPNGTPAAIKPPEAFVFEGHRAKASQGTKGLRLGGKGKAKGKPTTRSSKRGAAWKQSGGRKGAK